MIAVAVALAVTVCRSTRAPAVGVTHVASPRQNVLELADVPELRFPTGKLPVTPVVRGSPVAFVNTPEAGVPKAGVTNVGEVNVPVALVSTKAEGVPKAGVTKVKLVTVPEALVSTKAEGVPKAGVVSVGEVNVLLVSVSVPVLVTRFVGVMMSDKLAMLS